MVNRVLFYLLIISAFLGLSLNLAHAQVTFFQGSFKDLQKETSLSRIPYYVYFYVDDCENCDAMRQQTFSYPPLADFTAKNFWAYEVDCLDFGTGIDIATRYGIKEYPTVIVFGPDDEVRNRAEGFVGGGDLHNMLNQSVTTSDRNKSNRVINTKPYSNTSSNQNNPTGTRSLDQGSWQGTSNPPVSDEFTPSNPVVGSSSGQDTDATGAGTYKGGYVDAYMNNELKTYSDYNYGSPSGSQPPKDPGKASTAEELNYSYMDDNKRKAYQEASRTGYRPYEETSSQSPTRGESNPGTPAIADGEGYSYMDDYQRSGMAPSTGNPQGNISNQPPSGNNTGMNNQPPVYSSGEPSFLDPVGVTYSQQPQATRGMDEATLRQTEETWSSYPPPTAGDASTRSLGELTPEAAAEQPPYAASQPLEKPAPSKVESKTVAKMVPGFGDYSPKDITTNTFGLIIGEYKSLNDLKRDLYEVESHRDEPLWVYSAKEGTVHTFNLIIGEFKSEQEAVQEAIKMGASWDKIEVVNLANLN